MPDFMYVNQYSILFNFTMYYNGQEEERII